MSDKLKQFIEDNRRAFDSDEPGSRLLKNLRQEWDHGGQSKKVYQIKSIRWAAAIAGLIILSVALYFATQQQNAKDGIVRTSGENIDEKISASEPVYAKQIVHYQELIGLQQTELRRVEKEQPELYRQFAKDINQLDSAYRVLKITLTTNPNQEMLLEAMIRNLQFQSDLLNRQLLIIQEIKQKNKGYEKSTI